MAEMLFETFGVRRFQVGIEGVMSLYASGRETGIVLHSGHGVSHTAPVFQGYSMPHAMLRSDIGGGEVNHWLSRLLQMQSGLSLTSSSEMMLVQQIKEDYCRVSLDLAKEVAGFEPVLHTLPDGNKVALHAELLQAPELMFNPILDGKEGLSLPALLKSSIDMCDTDLREQLHANIVVSGGNTLFPNLVERLGAEMDRLDDVGTPNQFVAVEDRMYSVFQGASIVSGLSSFWDTWIPKFSDKFASPPIVGWDEAGESCIHRFLSV
eukprot:TRINITY_DN5095_c0_g1_i1.p1 TRINITY_DN5095_c0_g1~~TRINITY_DN5095_c0_g1_i1.p1  ORF type:complete len:265 (-),score=72.55 TRINITY_DN5095_c0_g1_i1:38-832(-)